MINRISGMDSAQVGDTFFARGTRNPCFAIGNINNGDPGVQVSVDHAVALKLQRRTLKWVGIWPLSRPHDIGDAIRSGGDGILVDIDRVKELAQIVQEPEFRPLLTPATIDDNPFAFFPGYTA